MLTFTHELGTRTYLVASVAAATYLFNKENSADGSSSFGPSFALRVALGFGFRL